VSFSLNTVLLSKGLTDKDFVKHKTQVPKGCERGQHGFDVVYRECLKNLNKELLSVKTRSLNSNKEPKTL